MGQASSKQQAKYRNGNQGWHAYEHTYQNRAQILSNGSTKNMKETAGVVGVQNHNAAQQASDRGEPHTPNLSVIGL